MGERATEAAHRGDQGELYRTLKELKVRGFTQGRDGGRSTVPNVEEEREAWKNHVEKVSKSRGEVNSRV